MAKFQVRLEGYVQVATFVEVSAKTSEAAVSAVHRMDLREMADDAEPEWETLSNLRIFGVRKAGQKDYALTISKDLEPLHEGYSSWVGVSL